MAPASSAGAQLGPSFVQPPCQGVFFPPRRAMRRSECSPSARATSAVARVRQADGVQKIGAPGGPPVYADGPLVALQKPCAAGAPPAECTHLFPNKPACQAPFILPPAQI